MPTEHRNTLCKEERLHGRNAVDELFRKAGSRSMTAFPLRVVYALNIHDSSNAGEQGKEGKEGINTRMLVSVPKRMFKRAVKRNRVKRQVREAYRKNKHCLCDTVSTMTGATLSLAFIWIDDQQHPSQEVEKKVAKLLKRLEEKIIATTTGPEPATSNNTAGETA